MQKYGSQVKLIYKHFPLDFHVAAQKAAEAYECAIDQNKGWEMHDKMFEVGQAATRKTSRTSADPMFKCEICGKVQPPHTRSYKVAVATRLTTYPPRFRAHQCYKIINGKPKFCILNDPGGVGVEPAREVTACFDCAEAARLNQPKSRPKPPAKRQVWRKSA